MEKFEEKQIQTSAKSNLNWISEFPQNTQMFRSLYLKILWVLDQTPIYKVVDPTLNYKVSVDKNLSVVQNSSE